MSNSNGLDRGKVISSIRCGVLRDCNNNQCVLRMIFNGLKVNPVTDADKKKNAEIERRFGKGFYPELNTIGKGEFLEVSCPEYKEKR